MRNPVRPLLNPEPREYSRRNTGLNPIIHVQPDPNDKKTVYGADLTGTVCRGKSLEIAAADKLAGWGISFGRYETAQIANMALRGRVLSARDWVRDGAAGVVKMPGSVGFNKSKKKKRSNQQAEHDS
jgi:hypothetical protein